MDCPTRRVKISSDHNHLTGKLLGLLLIVELINGLSRGIVEHVLAACLHATESAVLRCLYVGVRFHHGFMGAHLGARAIHDLAGIGLIFLRSDSQTDKRQYGNEANARTFIVVAPMDSWLTATNVMGSRSLSILRKNDLNYPGYSQPARIGPDKSRAWRNASPARNYLP